jgi:hypothetical protein
MIKKSIGAFGLEMQQESRMSHWWHSFSFVCHCIVLVVGSICRTRSCRVQHSHHYHGHLCNQRKKMSVRTKPSHLQQKIRLEKKLAALAAYRMAKGLCRKCGGKWSRGHRCAASVQLNIIQEVWDLIDTNQPDLQDNDSRDTQLFMVLSVAALTGIEAPKTLKITGVCRIMTLGILN